MQYGCNPSGLFAKVCIIFLECKDNQHNVIFLYSYNASNNDTDKQTSQTLAGKETPFTGGRPDVFPKCKLKKKEKKNEIYV